MGRVAFSLISRSAAITASLREQDVTEPDLAIIGHHHGAAYCMNGQAMVSHDAKTVNRFIGH
ncbi:MAG: hypothetical protein HOI33_04495 [Rhodospirillaceae bacterium]|nr:hypothetical protein [Rhodospirillaceae bacterium]